MRTALLFGAVRNIRPIPHVCEVWTISGPDADPDAAPSVLCDLPHGATQLAHLNAAKALVSTYPDSRYDKFFLANTDQGSPEYATRFAELICSPEAVAALPDIPESARAAAVERAATMKVLLIRCLIPRTIADVNRVWDRGIDFTGANLTGVAAPFLTVPADIAAVKERYDAYIAVARAAYDLICPSGHAFNLHTYAPISVDIIEGENIVDTLERAYTPEHFPSYPKRPEIELITAMADGTYLANEALVAELMPRYRRAGYDIQENTPFVLHPATTTTVYAQLYPERVLVVEVSRARLAQTFNPFIEMAISPENAEATAKPLAAGFLTFLVQSGLRRVTLS